jgi:hypothetical protein
MSVNTAMNRVFVFGAGFSKPAGLPLATELLPLLIGELELDEMREWLEDLNKRLKWLAGSDGRADTCAVNIEQVFHYAHFDAEVYRLQQHLAMVGRGDGPDTPWNQAESIEAWLSHLEDALRDVIHNVGEQANIEPIRRWAQVVGKNDAVLTFNYDTIVERALAEENKAWNHGTKRDDDEGVAVFKLHGSIDWIVAHRSESFSKLDLLFDKTNSNQSDGKTGHVEDDYRLWRCTNQEQLRRWIEGRDLQMVPNGASPREVGIAGLGAYKELHRVPGLGCVWVRGMRSLYQADLAVIVGFSMSDFDAMAQMQFAEIARERAHERRPLRVIVVDPCASEATQDRFRRVFRAHPVEFVQKNHEEYDWNAC